MHSRSAKSFPSLGSRVLSTRNRTERLRDRLPEAGFPRGAGAASAAGFVVMFLIACSCALTLVVGNPFAVFGGAGSPTVPAGVVAAQRRDAETLARAVAMSATSTAHDLRIAAGSHTLDDPNADQLLSSLSLVYSTWRGTALITADSHALLAARGEPVSVDTLAGVDLSRLTMRPVTRLGDVPLVLSAVPLAGVHTGQVLVVSTALRLTVPSANGTLRQHIRLVASDGTVPASTGSDVSADTGVRDLLATASAGTAGSGALTGASSTGPQPMAPVVAYAPVRTGAATGGLGLTVVTATWLPAATTPAPWPGLVAAGALLPLAAGGTLLLRRGMVAPIRRLRSDALAVAAGERTTPVRPSRLAEVRRTAAALERCRLRLLGETATRSAPTGRGVPARLLVGLVTAVLLTWSAAVFLTLGQQRADVPDALVAEQGLRLDRSTDTLRATVTSGLAELQAAVHLAAGRTPDQLQPVVDQLATDPVFRSVYAADRAGAVGERAGREPLRNGRLPTGVPPTGLHQHNTSGRVPVVYAYADLTGGWTLIGELDITRLAAPLQSAGGRVRVVDDGDRTIVDTRGYLAFDHLGDPDLLAATAAVRAGRSPGGISGTTVVTARGVARNGAAATLNWVVVAEQPVSADGIADNSVRDGAQGAALITAVLALLLCGWHELVVVRPLRRVAKSAETVASDSRGDPAYPERQDEIGTLASCVEVCRQLLAAGPEHPDEPCRVAVPYEPLPEIDQLAAAPFAEQVVK